MSEQEQVSQQELADEVLNFLIGEYGISKARVRDKISARAAGSSHKAKGWFASADQLRDGIHAEYEATVKAAAEKRDRDLQKLQEDLDGALKRAHVANAMKDFFGVKD